MYCSSKFVQTFFFKKKNVDAEDWVLAHTIKCPFKEYLFIKFLKFLKMLQEPH